LLKKSSEKLNHTNPELLYSLSQTSVAQHQFIQSASYISSAEKAKGDLYTIRLLQFDTYMELGKFAEAYKSLESLKDKESFDYIIRKAKWQDHKGNLSAAITLMEKAFEKVKDKNKDLYCWALSNLADMYGHAGRVQEAYNGYVNVLKKDPANLYCLKGIAWIAYAHDNNTTEAKRILQYILTQTEMPELKLMLAEIAETEGNMQEKQRLINEFVTTVTKHGYGDMYNKYLIKIYTEDTRDYRKALVIAEKELANRFTPEICDWLAWVQYKMGDIKKANETAGGFVANKTFEPDAILHTAYIYAANGKTKEARAMLNECLESSFELGPVLVKQIKEKLASL
jgi:tetratricopeptide (TPR) repeat protein